MIFYNKKKLETCLWCSSARFFSFVFGQLLMLKLIWFILISFFFLFFYYRKNEKTNICTGNFLCLDSRQVYSFESCQNCCQGSRSSFFGLRSWTEHPKIDNQKLAAPILFGHFPNSYGLQYKVWILSYITLHDGSMSVGFPYWGGPSMQRQIKQIETNKHEFGR